MRKTATDTMRWWAVILHCLLALSGRLYAEPLLPAIPFRVDHIGVADGLTQGSVYFMLKDSRGFMWFGTQDGLNCYDGHRFMIYRPDNQRRGTIRGVDIFGIVEDKQGMIWIGTEAGLNRYDRWKNQFTCFYTPPAPKGQRPVASRTLPFFADEKELLYLSDAEGLVSVNYRTLHKRVLHAGLKPKREYDLQSSTVCTKAGDVWLHAPMGLVRYNLNEKKLHTYFSDQAANEYGQPETIFSFHVDASNVVWLGTADGLVRFDYLTGATRVYSTIGGDHLGPIYSLTEDQQGRLWLGTQQQGIFFFDKHARLFGMADASSSSPLVVSQFEVNKIMVDNQGIIWANVDPDGLVKMVPESFTFGGLAKNHQLDALPADQRLSNFTIRSFAEFAATPADKAMPQTPLWVGTEAGINVLDQSSWRVMRRYLTNAPRSGLPTHNLIKRLYVDAYRRMWVGTIGGAYLFHPRDESFEHIAFSSAPGQTSEVADNYARDLLAVSADTLLAATETGIFQLSLATRRWQQRAELANQNLFTLYWEKTARRLWVGTYINGFVCYQLPPDGSAAPWQTVMTGLPGYTVFQVYDDRARRKVWLSTDRGLAALDRQTRQITMYTERDGLANAFVYGVLPDQQNNLWMSTNRGISRLDAATGQIKNFGLADGLQGLEFNGNALLSEQNGTLLFGGVNGFNTCRPHLYRATRTNPAVYLYNLRINDDPFGTDAVLNESSLTLNSAQNTFSLEFAAIDYLCNTPNRYSYRLVNYDADWVQAGEKNYVRYANVPPGDYVLEVRAANMDGLWSYRVHRLPVQIRPPFWRTIPFMVLLVASLGGLVLMWVRERENRLRTQQADQLRLAFNMQEQVKRDIARDLHDEIGTRLATLKLYNSQIARHMGDKETLLMLRNAINGLINDTIRDIRDLLRELNPRTLEQYGFGTGLVELLDRINATGAIQAHVNLNDERMRFSVDTELMLYRIIQELVNNTLKHANATEIDISCQYREERLTMTYTDNGQGFDYEQVRHGLGIGNIESRVAILQGTIQWQTNPGKGTSVLITLPVRTVSQPEQQSSASVGL